MLAPALLLIAATVNLPLALGGSVSADAGVEYDSNANRAPSDGSLGTEVTPRGGPLLRALTSGQLAYAQDRQRLRLQLQAGGKLFLTPNLQDQDVAVIATTYEHGAQFERVRLTGLIDYYDAFQAPATLLEMRDFRSLSVLGRLAFARPIGGSPGADGVEPRRHRIDGGLDLGGQLFMFKPDSSFSFLAPSLSGRFGTALHAGDPELGHDFDLGAHFRIDYRGYMYGRTDIFIQTGASGTWQGPLLVQLGYTVQLDLSNETDQSYQRHLLLAKIGARLPGDIYLTAKTQLNLLQGAPGLYVPVSNIDDDNRSLALLDLARPLPRGFTLVLRYTGYFSLPSESISPYQRHTAYVGASYAWKGQRR